MQHLLQTRDLGLQDVRTLLDRAKAFRSGASPTSLKDKVVGLIFFEASTQTRTTFEIATRRLGGSILNFSPTGASIQKGEALHDIARKCLAMGPSLLVVRHPSAGSPMILARDFPIPIINSGDGFHEHPTQALADVMTMELHWGSLAGKKVVILGDIAHSRVARSNISLLRALGAQVAVCGPPTLMPPHPEVLGVEFAYRPEELLPSADVLLVMRLQVERQNRAQIPSTAEYAKIWGLNARRANLLKPGALLLHAGPMRRGVEMTAEVFSSPTVRHLDQVENSIFARMSALSWVMESPSQ